MEEGPRRRASGELVRDAPRPRARRRCSRGRSCETGGSSPRLGECIVVASLRRWAARPPSRSPRGRQGRRSSSVRQLLAECASAGRASSMIDRSLAGDSFQVGANDSVRAHSTRMAPPLAGGQPLAGPRAALRRRARFEAVCASPRPRSSRVSSLRRLLCGVLRLRPPLARGAGAGEAGRRGPSLCGFGEAAPHQAAPVLCPGDGHVGEAQLLCHGLAVGRGEVVLAPGPIPGRASARSSVIGGIVEAHPLLVVAAGAGRPPHKKGQ